MTPLLRYWFLKGISLILGEKILYIVHQIILYYYISRYNNSIIYILNYYISFIKLGSDFWGATNFYFHGSPSPFLSHCYVARLASLSGPAPAWGAVGFWACTAPPSSRKISLSVFQFVSFVGKCFAH